MGQITSLFVRKVVAAVEDGVDKGALLRSVGLDPKGETDVVVMVDAAAYYGLLERVAGLTDGAADLPMRVGASMKCDDYGAFGLAWKTAPTLRASFARAERYARLLTSVATYEVRRTGADADFILHRGGERRLGLRMSNEATLASVAAISREVSSSDFAPSEVHFRHSAPASVGAQERYFGCPVFHDSDMDALRVPARALERPNRLGDEGVTNFLLSHLERELIKANAARSLADMVKDAISRSLSDGVPTVSDVARCLGMSPRTLHRRLRDEPARFKDLLLDARRELATGLLVHSDYSLAEIAFLAGFSEQSAFHRAFKRWNDQTPAAYRSNNKPS